MRNRQAGVVFVLITVSLDMLAFGIIAPVAPKYVLHFVNGDISHAALVTGAFGMIFAAMQLVFSPLLGMLSDRFGRRPVIILSNLFTGFEYVVWALAPSLAWLYVVRALLGMTTSSITTAYAYITDVTTPQKRAGAMGMVGAAFGVGFVVGPAIGGILGNIDIHLPFYVCGAMSLLNACYGFFVLPESLKLENRQSRLDWKRANALGSLRMLRSHPELSRLSVINFIEYVAHEVLPYVFTLYAMFRYHWNLAQVGWSLALVGISIAFVQAVVTQRAVAKLGERGCVIAGLACGCVAFALIGSSSSAVVALIGIVLLAFWGLAGPSAQSLMTHRVSATEQGELQGALGGMRSIAMLLGPGIFSTLFAYTTDRTHAWSLPGSPWFLSGALLVVAVVLTFGVADVRIKAGEPPSSTLAADSV